MFMLCPMFGLEGAAVAAGLSSIVAAAFRFYIAYRLNDGRLPLTRGIFEPAITSIVSTFAALLAFYVLRDVEPVWLRGAVALGVFLMAYGPLARRSFRLNSPACSASMN